ncbi:MAG: hypothetical protein M5R40_26900 [Anaerolineae bacterium]|nr:hypothetical protein [Anaerolineae bacterium]
MAARLELRERGGALAGVRKEPHQQAVGLFPERVELQEAVGVRDAGAVVGALEGVLAEPVQRLHHPPAQALLLDDHPVLEAARLADVEALQELALVKVQRRFELVRDGAREAAVVLPVRGGGVERPVHATLSIEMSASGATPMVCRVTARNGANCFCRLDSAVRRFAMVRLCGRSSQSRSPSTSRGCSRGFAAR